MQLTNFAQLAGVLLIHSIISASLSDQTRSWDNCPRDTSDYELSQSFPFKIRIRKNTQRKTWATTDEQDRLTRITIINERCIPPMLVCFKHLTKLEIRNSSFCDSKQQPLFDLKYLPTSLVHLEVDNVDLKYLSDSIDRFTNLTNLAFSSVNLRSFPSQIGNLAKLTYLSISYSNLTSLFVTPPHLPSLTQITLIKNPYLRSIQSINGLSALRILYLVGCPVDLLPRNLSHLTDLHMSHANLTHLAGIETLGTEIDYRKQFHFDHNRIESIPFSIERVRNLTRLILDFNNLSDLPKNIYTIKALQYISLETNKFHSKRREAIKTDFHKANANVTVHI